MRKIAAACGVVCVGFTLLAVGPVAAEAPAGGWTSAGKLSTQRPGPTLSALLSDGRVLVTGATSADYSGLGNVDVYDPATGWAPGPKLNGDPTGAVLAPLPNGSALLAGGTPWHGGFDGPGPGPSAAAMTFDPAHATWDAAPSMSRPRYGATATRLDDGRVLVAGGYDRKVTQLPNPDQRPFCCLQVDYIPLATTEIFDASRRIWSLTGTLVHARTGHAAVKLAGGHVLVVGGAGQPQTPQTFLSSAEIFDPTSGQWTAAGDIGEARQGFTLTALADGRALVAGGLAADGRTALRSTLLYDPVKNAWSSGPDMNGARTDHAAALMKDGRVVVAGGLDQLGRLASGEILDGGASQWTVSGALRTARSNQAEIALVDGRVLAIGGLGTYGQLDDAEIFDPSAKAALPAPRVVHGSGRWASEPPLPTISYGQTLSFLSDGRVLVLPQGGYPDFVAPIYDPRTMTWTQAFTRQTNPTGSDQASIFGVALPGDKVLLLTLDSQGQKPGRAEIVDVLTGAAKPAASPGALGGARLDILADGRVWLTSGSFGDKRSFFYDPVKDQWSKGPDLPADLYVLTVTRVPRGRVLVGGFLQAMIWDPTGGWTEVATYPKRWTGYSATALPDGDVLLAGGTEDQEQPDGRITPVATVQVMRWNHTTGAMTGAPGMPAPNALHSSVVLTDGRVLFAGGVVSGDFPSDATAAVELYDPVKNSWSQAQSMPEARAQMSTILLKDGTVLEAGGFGFFNAPHTLVYSPDPAPRPAAARVARPASSGGIVASVAALVGAGLISLLLIASARRRRRSAWRP